jgi:beta-1,4-mannooligosaccharide/beta-1,4-mannosyl-N-acetylglucosamine phosphorylase
VYIKSIRSQKDISFYFYATLNLSYKNKGAILMGTFKFEPVETNLTSSKAIKRYSQNPVLSPKDVPFECHLTYNAGITKFKEKYYMVFRNDVYDNPETESFSNARINLGLAISDDGKSWEVRPTPCFTVDNITTDHAWHVYDPRLTVLEGRCYMCFAVNTFHGIRGGIAVTDDFKNWEVLHLTTPDNRNMVLFPEKIDGYFIRLERPFPVYGRSFPTRFDVWASKSPDMKFWGESSLVLGVEDVPFANDKIGPAAPPVKTNKGWLTTFHAVDIDESRRKNGWEKNWKKRYTAGIMLLDLKNPNKVFGMSKMPLITPEVDYEISGGLRNNVIFPGGMILEDDGEVKLYYGAADTVECLATANVDDLIALCTEKREETIFEF